MKLPQEVEDALMGYCCSHWCDWCGQQYVILAVRSEGFDSRTGAREAPSIYAGCPRNKAMRTWRALFTFPHREVVFSPPSYKMPIALWWR